MRFTWRPCCGSRICIEGLAFRLRWIARFRAIIPGDPAGEPQTPYPDPERGFRRLPGTMITHIQGMKVYYEAVGDGNPVVLLHGWGVDSSAMRPLLTLIRDQASSRAYALDFPGFGFSDPPPQAWGVSEFVHLLEGFLDSLGLTRVDIIAHSFGGRVAIKLAAQNPQRVGRLVLVDSAGIRRKRTASYRLKVALAKTVKFLFKTVPGLARALRLDRLVARQGSSDYRNAGQLRTTFVKVVNEDLQSCLPLIQSQTLLVWGSQDDSTPLADGQRMQALIPGARLEVIPGAGHFSYADHFAEFSRILIPFLKGEMR